MLNYQNQVIDLDLLSPRERIQLLPEKERQQFWDSLTEEKAKLLLYDWQNYLARPKQRFPKTLGQEHFTWLILAGRGYGKTDTGSNTIKYLVEEKGYRNIALVGRTSADVRDVMVEGPAGILAAYPEEERPLYEPAKRKITFKNGAVAHTYSADKPDQLRGPQHDAVWGDELAAWRYSDAYDQLMFGLRLGTAPVAIFTTTPRPTKLIKELIKDPTTIVTKGTTFENARNLAAPALAQLIKKYAGTRLGLQELEAHILDDTPGALWTRNILDEFRVRKDDVPDLVRVVVGIDPAVTANEESDETGIIAAGKDRFGHIYVLDDYSIQSRPQEWANRAIALYDIHDADRIVAEVNQGGDMVETTIRSVRKKISFKQVRASKGKFTRAEPVSALYEQGLVHHVGAFGELEDQMCTWVQGEKSPDRIDALVWAITELALKNQGKTVSAKTDVRGMYPSQERSRNQWEKGRRHR